jgi:hypothetical protein
MAGGHLWSAACLPASDYLGLAGDLLILTLAYGWLQLAEPGCDRSATRSTWLVGALEADAAV